MELYPFKSGGGAVEPVAIQNQNIAVHYLGTIEWRRVIFYESIPPFQFLNIGAIAAQTISARTQATNLRMPDDELLQLRWWPIDPVQVRVFLPTGVAKHSLLNAQSVVSDTIVTEDPDLHLTELFCWEDNNPAFEAVNFSDFALAACRLKGMGYRIVTELLPEAKRKQITDAINRNGPGAETSILGTPCVHILASGRAS